jgi:hypothetical protein
MAWARSGNFAGLKQSKPNPLRESKLGKELPGNGRGGIGCRCIPTIAEVEHPARPNLSLDSSIVSISQNDKIGFLDNLPRRSGYARPKRCELPAPQTFRPFKR